jgi:hypothetical protein
MHDPACQDSVFNKQDEVATMRKTFSFYLFSLFLITGLGKAGLVMAEDATSKASHAVTTILFDYDADEFTTYSIDEDGVVDITFAKNTPDALYSKILNALQNDPDIKGVLAGKGGPVCSQF